MAPFVTSLPKEAENLRWSILAPENGFEGTVRDLQRAQLEGTPISLWLNVFRDDLFAWLRVNPDLSEFKADISRHGVYHLDRGNAVFIDEDGNETDNWVDFTAFFTTEITTEGLHAGVIVMWRMADLCNTSPDNRSTA